MAAMDEALLKRVLPHSVEAEQSVIGSMIMDREAIVVASEILHGEDFYGKQYGIVFEAMVELNDEGKPVDLVTLQNRLKEKDVPPEVSSLEFVRNLITAVPTSANIKYYANIVLPYSDIVLRFLDTVTKMGLSPKIIAPDHGFIWRKDPSKIINLYAKWAAQAPKNKAVVVYDTMWGSTQKMAEYIADGLREGGTEVKLMSMHSCHRSDVVTELLDSSGLIIGSPVLNSEIFPAMADVLCYLKGLKKKNLVGGAFGSYGWNPAPVNSLAEMLKAMKVEQVAPVVSSKFVPNAEVLQQCRQLGLTVSQKIAEKLK